MSVPAKRVKAHPTPFQNLGGPLFPPSTDLSPTSIFPPTPMDLFTTILPLTPPDATKSPRYVKELWDDFDQLENLPRACVPPPPPPSPVPMVAKPIPTMPRIGVWRSSSSSTSSSTSKGRGHAIVQALLPPPAAQPAAATSSFPLGPYLPPAPPLKKKRRRHPRGFYRCRKCGGAKRAHDCPFACRQKSMATQTNLEITGAARRP